MLVYDAPHKPTSKKYFEQLFPSEIFIWKDIYLLVRKVTTDCYLRPFQYKILNNILFLNKELSVFGISNSSLCSFCNLYDETITHLYCHCKVNLKLWKDLSNFLKNYLSLPDLNPQAAFFGFLDLNDETFLIVNRILLTFKFYLYNSRNKKTPHLQSLLKQINKIKDIEKKLSENNEKKRKIYCKKW